MLREQRNSGMAPGAVSMLAAEVLFDWTQFPRKERLELWICIKQIDSIFLSNTMKRE